MSSVTSDDSASCFSASASGGDVVLSVSNLPEEDDSGYDYNKLNGHAPLSLSTSGSCLNGVYKIPRVETVDECDEGDEAADSGGSHTPDDLSVTSDKEITVETQAMVHNSGPPSEEAEDHRTERGDPGSDSSPFLNRTDSDKSDTSGPRRGRNYKGDSVSSDASSGFHSCYYPDDVTPTEAYSPGPFPHPIPPKEVMV